MDKDIRFTEKKIDESWKEQAGKEKIINVQPNDNKNAQNPAKEKPKTAKEFLGFLTSLAMQVMMLLGEMPNPETGESDSNPAGAREILDLLIQIKLKTQGNLSDEEQNFFDSVLPELQMKFAQKV